MPEQNERDSEKNKDSRLIVVNGAAIPTVMIFCTVALCISAGNIKDSIESFRTTANEIAQNKLTETTDQILYLRGDLGEINKRIGNLPLALDKMSKDGKQTDPKAEVAKDVLSLMERADDGSSITVKTAENGARVFVVRSGGKIYEVSASTGKKMTYPRPEFK